MARTRQPRRLTRSLSEDIVRGMAPLAAGQQRVDLDKGIIYGVKVLGLESLNGRRYTPEAVRKAVPLYEGKGVFVDHPVKPGDPRHVTDRFGWLESVRLGADGCLYADLHILLPKSGQAELVMAAAIKKPDLFGLSHNAQGAGDERDGVFVVEEITDVRSVDVVTEPATTAGLFEGRKPMTVKIRQLFEASWKKAYSKKVAKRPRLAAAMKRLVEDDALGVMDEPAEGMDKVPAEGDEAMKDGFCAVCDHIIEKALSGEMDPTEALKELKQVLDSHSRLTGGDDAPEDDLEEEDEEVGKKKADDEEEKDKEEMEQLRRENLVHREAGRLGVQPDEVLLEALMGCKDARTVKKLLEREKGKGKSGTAPRSGATGSPPRPTLEGIDTPEGTLAALMGN